MFDRQSIHVALLLWGCIFSLIAALCIFMSKNFEKRKRKVLLHMLLSCAILMLSDSVAWAYRGEPGKVGYYIVRISNFLVFLFSDVMLGLYHAYVCCSLFGTSAVKNKKTNYKIRAVFLLAVIGMFLVILTQFTGLYYSFDSQNFYHRNQWYFLSLLIPMLGMLLDCSLIIQYRKNIAKRVMVALLSYIVLPFVAAIILLFYYGISLINIAINISMIEIFVEAMVEQSQMIAEQERSIARQERKVAEQERMLAEQTKELTESRISSMKSQIRTHFIFNVLGSISGYCKINPQKADEQLARFSRYLRRNMRFMEEQGMIDFLEEVRQVEDYVALEQMRFEDMIEFGEDLEYTDFKIPPLTVQPLVENAIKHGLVEHDRAGSVCLFTRKEDDNIVIEVVDDGYGFEVEELEKDESIGIRNVRYRLEHLVGATLQMESTPGEGSKAIISIPAQREK